MKEYMKMSDCFDMPLRVSETDAGYFVIMQKSGFSIAAEFECDAETEAVTHAINSHDELVAEVERLQGILGRIIKSAQTLSKKMPSTEFGDGYKQCAMDTAGAIESLINKGA